MTDMPDDIVEAEEPPDDIDRGLKIRPPVVLDEPRAMMYDELVDEMGEDAVKSMVGENLKQMAHSVVTALYDNREQVGQAREQVVGDGDVD